MPFLFNLAPFQNASLMASCPIASASSSNCPAGLQTEPHQQRVLLVVTTSPCVLNVLSQKKTLPIMVHVASNYLIGNDELAFSPGSLFKSACLEGTKGI